MTLVLHKLLPLVVSPLGLVVLLVALSVILRHRGPALIGLIMLLVCSIPMTADRLWGALEADYPYRSIESVEDADAIVVLSGMLGWLETEDTVVPQWTETTDRLFAGVDLLNAGKAPLIIFTRAQNPWRKLPPEGDQLAKRAIAMGVQERQILLTGTVTNTADEADEVKALMDLGGIKRIILVTSAFHMPRARMLFDRAGVDSAPYPTDFRSSLERGDWTSLIPSAGGLHKTSEAVREFIGRLYYRAMFSLDT